MRMVRWAAAAAAAALLAGCGSGSGTFAGRKVGSWGDDSAGGSASSRSAGRSTAPTSAPRGDAPYAVQGSVNQVAVTDAVPGDTLHLTARGGDVFADGIADSQGSFVFRNVPAGSYVVTSGKVSSGTFRVVSEKGSTPKQSFYSRQKLVDGFGYITTRDGTKLSASVYLPPGDGPFPTVVEYSGYDPSNPTHDLKSDVKALGLDPDAMCASIPLVCRAPAQPMSMIASAMGYAVVAVNVRGTGCSGGSYDFFEPLQLLDGYDVIETVAAQPWVRGHKVGMVGLSYPGIAELFVASTQPPHLAAITPMSVYDDTARGVLAPGGLFNKGFALQWASSVLEDAKPLGQGWEQKVIDAGDTTCGPNQKLRGQNVDAVAKAQSSKGFYDPRLGDPVNPTLFADKIDVPVFMTGAWQDEQTGPGFPKLWDKLTNAPVRKFFGFNGAHADGASPETLVEWKAFLDFYVAGERTPIPDLFKQFGSQLVSGIFGADAPFPPERLLGGDFGDLKRQYESEPEVTILWDRGGDAANRGAPIANGSTTFDNWPPKQTPTRWFFQPDGTMSTTAPSVSFAAARWTTDPSLADAVTLPGGSETDAFLAAPAYRWNQEPSGSAAVFVTPPMASDTVLLGGGSADLWIRSSTDDADLGVTLSEVRPDGKETYLQSGFLHALIRKPGAHATELDPDHTGLEADAEPLVPGRWTEARVEILPVGAVIRKGSRLRLSIHTPGGDKPRWSWILSSDQRPTVDVATDAAHPSSVVLPVVAGVTGYRPTLPPCPSLRGQPCRTYQRYTNEKAPAS